MRCTAVYKCPKSMQKKIIYDAQADTAPSRRGGRGGSDRFGVCGVYKQIQGLLCVGVYLYMFASRITTRRTVSFTEQEETHRG